MGICRLDAAGIFLIVQVRQCQLRVERTKVGHFEMCAICTTPAASTATGGWLTFAQIRDEVDIACYLTSIGMVDVSAKMQRSAPPVALINQTIKLKAP